MAVPTKDLTDQLASILASDVASLGSATACKVHLIAAPFTPGPMTDLADLTEATFTGSAAKAAGTGTQQIGNAPGTGLRWVQMLEPAGGWTFKCTAAPSSPETVYGWVLTDGAGTTTWFSALLPDPVVIADVGDTVAIPWARVTYVAPVLN